MTNQTEQGAAPALLPCPFCACSMAIEPVARDWWRLSGDHDMLCMLRSSETDVPQTPEQLAALAADWNRRAPVSTPEGYTSVKPAAWQHGTDSARVISASVKAQAERDGGASASSVAPYITPLVAVPAGYALVPLEPTDEMEKAFFATATGACASYFADEAGYEGAFKRMYQLMVAATPGDSHAT